MPPSWSYDRPAVVSEIVPMTGDRPLEGAAWLLLAVVGLLVV